MANLFWSLDVNSNDVWSYTVDSHMGVLTPTNGFPLMPPPPGAGYTPQFCLTPNGLFGYCGSGDGTSILGYRYSPNANTYSFLGFTPIPDPSNSSIYGGLQITPNGLYLYCADQSNNGIFGYAINQISGALTLLPGFPVPANTAGLFNGSYSYIDNAGKLLFVYTNTGQYAISAYPINADGSLGSPVVTNMTNPSAPFTPCTLMGKYLYVPDQFQNNVTAYSYTNTGALTFISAVPSGSGVQWMGQDVVNNFLYIPSGPDGTVWGYTIDGTGAPVAMPGTPWPCATYSFLLTAWAGAKSGYILVGLNDGVNSILTMNYNLSTGILDPTTTVLYPEAAGGSNGQSIFVVSTFDGTSVPGFIDDYSQPYLVSALGSYTAVIKDTGATIVALRFTDVATPHKLSATVTQNGVLVATVPVNVDTQNDLTLVSHLCCTDGDVIVVTISSAAASDSNSNQVRGFINIHAGVS